MHVIALETSYHELMITGRMRVVMPETAYHRQHALILRVQMPSIDAVTANSKVD